MSCVGPKGMLIQPHDPEGLCFPPDLQAALAQVIDLRIVAATSTEALLTQANWLRQASVLVGTWGMPLIDQSLLSHMPRLEAVFYAGGSVQDLMVDAGWRRGVRVSSAIALNSEPVAQFALAQVLFALKLGWHHVARTKQLRQWKRIADVPGSHGSRVGIVSLGLIGRRLVELLKPFGVELVAYDIRHDQAFAAAHDVRHVSLTELFATSQVATIHTPMLPGSRGMIGGDLIRSMPPNAVLINTARGGVIDQPAMIDALRQRPDIMALLDVTDPEPPTADCPLWTMPNVVLTPHIAGAFGFERRRLGQFILAEVERYVRGKILLGEVPAPLDPPEISVMNSAAAALMK